MSKGSKSLRLNLKEHLQNLIHMPKKISLIVYIIGLYALNSKNKEDLKELK